MVAHLVRLKLALLRNIFRRSRAQAIGAVVGIVYFAVLVVGITVILSALRAQPADARVVVPLAGAVGVVLWTVVPLFSFGSDPTLDPARFATLAVPPRQLAVGLIAAALVGLPAIASFVLSVGVVVAWSQTVVSTLVAVVATAVGLLTAITLSRVVSALATATLTTRRGNDVMILLGVAAFLVLGPVVSTVANAEPQWREVFGQVARIVGWTPLGWAFAAPGDVVAGEWATALARLALAGVFLWLLGLAWAAVLRRQVENPRAVPRSDSAAAADGDLGLFARVPDTRLGAVAARMLTYWRRDPRYQVGMIMTPFVPLTLLLPYYTGDIWWTPLAMAPLVAFLLGWSEHNSVAYEADAFWMHVAAGLPGTDDRRGRLVPSLLLAAVLVPAYSVGGALVAGRADLLPAVLGVSVCLLGAGYAVSSVMSVVMPYPVPKPGESPFHTPPGAAGVTMLAQMLASIASLVVAAPALLLGLVALGGAAWAAWLAAAVGVVLGPVLAVVGTRTGARLYERRAPELLSAISRD